ncbi:hypothetical protein BD779DRAFT_1579235, partial [Infundibulicybe gibba]
GTERERPITLASHLGLCSRLMCDQSFGQSNAISRHRLHTWLMVRAASVQSSGRTICAVNTKILDKISGGGAPWDELNEFQDSLLVIIAGQNGGYGTLEDSLLPFESFNGGGSRAGILLRDGTVPKRLIRLLNIPPRNWRHRRAWEQMTLMRKYGSSVVHTWLPSYRPPEFLNHSEPSTPGFPLHLVDARMASI